MVLTLPDADWSGQVAGLDAAARTRALEEGAVLSFTRLAFPLSEAEQGLLRTDVAAPGHKNISFDAARDRLAGVAGDAAQQAAVHALLARYHETATRFVQGLVPHYRDVLQHAPTSLRLFRTETRETSWRKDDSRLHVDAFPSRPNYGRRILRVFTNISPLGEDRVWRVGDRFEAVARQMLPRIRRMWPGEAAVLNALKVTKQPRSEYDHLMLGLHDAMKHDLDYQRDCPQETVRFPAGSVWVCFSDQVAHAAMSGQFMMEQTYFLEAEHMAHPELSPLGVLERLKGKPLAPRVHA
ncbi:Kdo hydroxylase family protein [Niveibacterium sp. SC-1]|uniref:Kdo hydroxylase family protein n=1 Tax=Niveibacterium sp. SC-1 TaxID=3135646 RepID=UPI00311DFBA7